MKYLFSIVLCLLVWSIALSQAQEMPLSYELGENYNDRYKYSNVLSLDHNEDGGMILVRNFYGGMVLKPKGYCIEVYDDSLNLKLEDTYKYTASHMITGFAENNKLFLLELRYNYKKQAYQYIVHESSLKEIRFKKRTLLTVPAKEVTNPLARNKYRRNFTNGFSTAVHFDKAKSAFVIRVNAKRGKLQTQRLYVYDADFTEKWQFDLTNLMEDKNYAFEEITISEDIQAVYLIGKAYFKKNRFEAKERRFQYELVRVSQNGYTTQEFNDPGRYPEALKVLYSNNKLVALGFYADRKDNRYNGLVYFEMEPQSLIVQNKKYNAFSEQFMLDKFGREDDKEIKNLIFKDIHRTSDNGIVFSAEEYFMTTGESKSVSGANVKLKRFHYNDIVCAKLSEDGTMRWARNINKAEVTQGDAAYASYTSYGKGDAMYFFINSGEHPQQLSKNRILFKQGYSRNPNLFVLRLDDSGALSYKKLVDDKDVRLPIMVSKPLIQPQEDRIVFYAKRGNKKQLVRVNFNRE